MHARYVDLYIDDEEGKSEGCTYLPQLAAQDNNVRG